MKCPHCGVIGDTKVLESKQDVINEGETIVRKRRRKCKACKKTYVTLELARGELEILQRKLADAERDRIVRSIANSLVSPKQ